jgi:hypothetical protein
MATAGTDRRWNGEFARDPEQTPRGSTERIAMMADDPKRRPVADWAEKMEFSLRGTGKTNGCHV